MTPGLAYYDDRIQECAGGGHEDVDSDDEFEWASARSDFSVMSDVSDTTTHTSDTTRYAGGSAGTKHPAFAAYDHSQLASVSIARVSIKSDAAKGAGLTGPQPTAQPTGLGGALSPRGDNTPSSAVVAGSESKQAEAWRVLEEATAELDREGMAGGHGGVGASWGFARIQKGLKMLRAVTNAALAAVRTYP